MVLSKKEKASFISLLSSFLNFLLKF